MTIAKDIVFVAAKRTPFGTLQGALKGQSANDLAVHAAKAALAQSGLTGADIDHVIVGNVLQSSSDAIYCARHVGLKAGVPLEVPAVIVNRLCGSGFEAIVQGAHRILLGEARAVLVGGTENMTQAPHVVRGAREGFAFGKAPQLEDSLWTCLTDSMSNTPMAVTAENLAQKYGISREECDQFALASQQRWAAAQAAGAFADEIAPMALPGKKKDAAPIAFAADEHPRPQSTIESLAKLPPVFKKDGVVTAGNASGICDGAAMLVMTSAELAAEKGLTVLARLAGYGACGVEPTLMGIGPAYAIPKALAHAGRSAKDVDLYDINEAFAPQWLACQKHLELPPDRCNIHGGAIALGHPLGASGARIAANLIYSLARRNQRVGVGSACIGGGQGIAIVIERA